MEEIERKALEKCSDQHPRQQTEAELALWYDDVVDRVQRVCSNAKDAGTVLQPQEQRVQGVGTFVAACAVRRRRA